MNRNICIHWFRQDLRISDNPSFYEASQNGLILPIYILDEVNSKEFALGGASRWWLHNSLNALSKSLDGNLKVFKGNPEDIILDLTKAYEIQGVYWNRCYEPWQIKRDKKIKDSLSKTSVQTKSFNGSLLWEPWEVLKKDNSPYKVFTPFYKNGCLNSPPPNKPLPKPNHIKYFKNCRSDLKISDLHLLPSIRWDNEISKIWKVGESAAHAKLKNFIKNKLTKYKTGRDYPESDAVSKLSPHLHFGEISPSQIWHKIAKCAASENKEHFLRELSWREFSYNLLYHFPTLPKSNFQSKFDDFPWKKDRKLLSCWQKGQTGYPLIDAGMRELWRTGYMHNRIRMVVGSFLVKNLLLHWHHGERWFWDCLLDADLANNSASWQWVAGCGADAAPYFRIFNPITQGHKFDPQGTYTRKYVPELKNLPNKFLFSPWEAPKDLLQQAGVILGKSYPAPIVDLKLSREKALQAYRSI